MQLTLEMDQHVPSQQVLPVMTRVVARRELERQIADDKATEESGAVPLALDDMPDQNIFGHLQVHLLVGQL